MFNPTRDQARAFLFETWRKYHAKEPLTALEALALEVVSKHPEYHAILESPDRYADRDYTPEHGETNPFLHMNLHLAIEEQLSIDQPQGIREHYERLCHAVGSEHDAQHRLMECLAEMIWQSQRTGTPPDASVYLQCVEEQATRA